jgi:carboxyl-terminal processing protease
MFLFFRFLNGRLAQGIIIGVIAVVVASSLIGPLKLEYRTSEATPVPGATPTPVGTLGDLQDVPDDVAPGQEFEVLQEIYNILRDNSLIRSDLDSRALQDQTIEGLLSTLDDPYLRYSPPQAHQSQGEQLAGVYEGIGAEVSLRDGPATIIAPYAGSPAEQAGIRPGDVILEVEGLPTENWTLEQLVSNIKGEAGTDVHLLVLHLNDEVPVLVTVTRGVIPIQAVFMTMVGEPDEGIAYLRISTFSDSAPGQLKTILQQALDDGARGIVIDVRYNPGGFLQATLDATSEFLAEGLILTEVHGDGTETRLEASSGGLATDLPLAILINQFSASGSEVFAGALADHGRAKTFGAPTFGKGSVTTSSSLSNGYGLSYTLARWLTPNGTLIEGEGLEPQVGIEQPHEVPILSTGDLQLLEAIDYLREALE